MRAHSTSPAPTSASLAPAYWDRLLVRDPSGRFDPQALLSTDPTPSASQVVGYFVRRWQLEGHV